MCCSNSFNPLMMVEKDLGVVTLANIVRVISSVNQIEIITITQELC